jgi:hypothetical protein
MDQGKDTLKARFAAATTTPEGDLRVERIAAAAAVVVALVALRVWGERRRRARRRG